MANSNRTVYQSINSLVDKPQPKEKLKPPETPDAIRKKTGLERKRADEAAASVNSQEVTVTSTDGLFTFAVRVLV